MARRRQQYKYTARRKAAWRRAQAKGAKMRKGKAMGGGKKTAAVVGVLAVGVGIGVVLGRKHPGPQGGGPKNVIHHKPAQAKPDVTPIAQVVENARPAEFKTATQTAQPIPQSAASAEGMTKRVLVTGSRDWNDHQAIYNALGEQLAENGSIVVVHGNGRGADRIASGWARAQNSMGRNVTEEVHHAQWDALGKKAGPMRNIQMVNSGADIALAFPTASSVGTRHTMKLAAIAGIKIRNYGY